MSDDPQMEEPDGPRWPLPQGGFDLSQVLRMLHSDGPVNWDVAGQVADWTAVVDQDTGGAGDDPEPDPVGVEHLEGIVRAAQTHAAAATGLSGVLTVPVRVLTRRRWAAATLGGLHQVIEALATAFAVSTQEGAEAMGEPHASPQPPAEISDLLAALGMPANTPAGSDPFAGLMAAIGPVVIGVQSGTMIGFLAQQALGQYDLPLPLTGEPRLSFVLSNVDAFAESWSLPSDDLRFTLALRETVHAAQRCVPWVRERLLRLSSTYVAGYRLDPDAIERQLGELDLSDPASLGSTAEVALDPAALLDAMRTPEQEPTLDELRRFAAVLEGYTDAIVDRAGEGLVASLGRIEEALRRHRVERGKAEAFVDRLLGLDLGRDHYEQGVEFCRGVVERAGDEALNRLWTDESMVPTASELEAPGLWLARIDLNA